MSARSKQLDLILWKDKELIIRQNQLKDTFWELFSQIANSEVSKKIGTLHRYTKGTKLSKGNDLLGFPYQVLDLVRDFDPARGLNVRILNWFGHGIFIFILFGKENLPSDLTFFRQNGFLYSLSQSPWDYPELILSGNFIENPDSQTLSESSYHQWFKEISIEESTEMQLDIENELKKILAFFDDPMG